MHHFARRTFSFAKIPVQKIGGKREMRGKIGAIS